MFVFLIYFPYKCIHSPFKIHSVFVTDTVAKCSVYLRNLKCIASIHCQHPLENTENANGVTFVTRKLMSREGPIFTNVSKFENIRHLTEISTWKLIGHFAKYHNTLCLSPQISISIVSSFFRDFQWYQEKTNNVYAKFAGTNKEYYGIFRNGLLERFYGHFEKLDISSITTSLVLWFMYATLHSLTHSLRQTTPITLCLTGKCDCIGRALIELKSCTTQSFHIIANESYLVLKSDLNWRVSFCPRSLYCWPSGQILRRHIGEFPAKIHSRWNLQMRDIKKFRK